MRFLTLFSFFCFLTVVSLAQDKLVLNNGDTLISKINRHDNNRVEYQLIDEDVSESISTQLVRSIILGSGRVIKPEIQEAKKIAPVFGFYKGISYLSTDDNNFGLPHLRTGHFEGTIIDDVIDKIKASNAMTGGCMVTYKLEDRSIGQPYAATAEFYAFKLPSATFIKDNIIGKTFKLMDLYYYALGQPRLLSFISHQTVEHALEFTTDFKIIEDGKPAGNYSVKEDEITLKYAYTNKKGKVKDLNGSFKVGSFDNEFIQLYFANTNFTAFESVILKRVSK